MKLVKTANGHKIKMSRSEWESYGRKAGWLSKKASVDCQECGETIHQETNNDKCPHCGGDIYAAEREDAWEADREFDEEYDGPDDY